MLSTRAADHAPEIETIITKPFENIISTLFDTRLIYKYYIFRYSFFLLSLTTNILILYSRHLELYNTGKDLCLILLSLWTITYA